MRRRSRSRAVWCLVLAFGTILGVSASSEPRRPDAETILRRADQVLNPFTGVAIDFELQAVDRESGREWRRTHYRMLTHRNGQTLLLAPGAETSPPGAALIADGAYWLLPPKADRPAKLALRHVVSGDLSHAGFLRLNLRLGYTPREDGEETVEGTRCWRLELRPRDAAPFPRIRYWVAQDGFRPIRIEFYDGGEAPLKTVRIPRYQATGRGPRPERIEIEDRGRPRELAVLQLGKPSFVRTSDLAFDPDDLLALRDAARDPADAEPAKLVEALKRAARQRLDRETAQSAKVKSESGAP